MILPDNLYSEALKHILETHKKATPEIVMEGFADYFYQKTVTEIDKKLIDFAFGSELDQQHLDEFLKDWDIERAGSAKSLLVSYIMKIYPELKFNEYTLPRLKGLLNFFRFKNLSLIAQYTKIVEVLNKNGIVPMIIKGGAMKHLRPDFPRVMGDIDILVQSEEEYKLAKKLVTDMGYEIEDNVHSIDLHHPGSKEGILDIHQFIEMGSPEGKAIVSKLFERATKEKVFNTDTYVPCAEDMVFISLVNMVKNLRDKTSLDGILYNLFDLQFFKEKNLDWNLICKSVIDTHTEPQICIACKFLDKIKQGFVPNLLNQDKKMEKAIAAYCNKDIFYCLYVVPVKYVCKGLHFKDAVKSWESLKYYLRVKGQHFFTKRIAKSQILTDLFIKIVH